MSLRRLFGAIQSASAGRRPTSSLDKAEAAVDCSHLHERSVFQAISAAALPSRFHYSEFQSACGTRREQDGFQPAAGDRGVRAGRRRALPGDRAPHAAPARNCSFSSSIPIFLATWNGSLRTIRASTSSMAMPRSCPRKCNAAGSLTATTSSPAFRSASSTSRKKRALLQKTHEAVAPGGSFIIYQVTNELRQHATRVRQSEIGIFSAKHTADVHHGISESSYAERP